MKKTILVLVFVAMALLCVLPASATVVVPGSSSSATGTILNSHDVTQTVIDNSVTQQAGVTNTENVFSPSSTASTVNNYNTMESNGIYNLDTGVIELDRVLISDQVLVLPIPRFGTNATVFQIVSATPIAVWTIDGSVYSTSAIKAEQSKLTYDKVYDKLDHGTVVPVDAVPYFTTKCTITPSNEASYIVLDNRYYPEDAVTQIQFGDSGNAVENSTYVSEATPIIGTTDTLPVDSMGNIVES